MRLNKETGDSPRNESVGWILFHKAKERAQTWAAGWVSLTAWAVCTELAKKHAHSRTHPLEEEKCIVGEDYRIGVASVKGGDGPLKNQGVLSGVWQGHLS